jgi:hypothetical protein
MKVIATQFFIAAIANSPSMLADDKIGKRKSYFFNEAFFNSVFFNEKGPFAFSKQLISL